jgi:hypothetical protein
VPFAASPPVANAAPLRYRRREPETTALHEVVRDNLETLYGAIDDGAHPEARPEGAGGLPRLWPAVPRLRAPAVRVLPGEPAGGVQLQGAWLLPVVHGTADVLDGGEPDAPRVARDRPAPVGADLPVLVEAPAVAGRRPAGQAHAAQTVHAFYAGRAEEEGATGAKTGSVNRPSPAMEASSRHGSGGLVAYPLGFVFLPGQDVTVSRHELTW